MGGKSVTIRCAALAALMAHVGSYVPAQACTLSCMDGIFTRMGASDNLLLGRSTFEEELGDVADVMRRATSRRAAMLRMLAALPCICRHAKLY
jgi:DNA mismatch repair protein MSH3